MPTRHSPTKPKPSAQDVDSFLLALDHPHKTGIELLRQAILGADDRIGEEIKWNAPSFKLGDHFLTFRLHPPRHIQLVFHVGAKPLVPVRTLALDLPAAATKWAAPDRCVVTISDSQQAKALAPHVARAVRQWLAQLHSQH